MQKTLKNPIITRPICLLAAIIFLYLLMYSPWVEFKDKEIVTDFGVILKVEKSIDNRPNSRHLLTTSNLEFEFGTFDSVLFFKGDNVVHVAKTFCEQYLYAIGRCKTKLFLCGKRSPSCIQIFGW